MIIFFFAYYSIMDGISQYKMWDTAPPEAVFSPMTAQKCPAGATVLLFFAGRV